MTVKRLQGLIEHNENLNKQITSYLQEALVLLLDKKSLNDITITELCQKAGVSRMAFYGNYKSKEDLYEQIVRTLNTDLVAAVGNPFNRLTGKEWYVNFFSVMAENANTVHRVFSADKNRYIDALNFVILKNRQLNDEQKYRRLLWAGGMVNATLYWIESGMDMPVSDIALHCYHSLESVLSDYPLR